MPFLQMHHIHQIITADLECLTKSFHVQTLLWHHAEQDKVCHLRQIGHDITVTSFQRRNSLLPACRITLHFLNTRIERQTLTGKQLTRLTFILNHHQRRTRHLL